MIRTWVYANATVLAFLTLTCSSRSIAQNHIQKQVQNSLGMKLKRIPEGIFIMGSPAGEEGSKDDERQNEVMIDEPFYLGIYEVTQAQYYAVMGNNPSYFQGDRIAERHPQTGRVTNEVNTWNHPVDEVSWNDAAEFCRRISELPEEKKARRSYQLPTEVQWEYACRAGTTTPFNFGEDSRTIDEHAWFIRNSEGKTHPVGMKKPNAWGLYVMHGNVREWCSDWYGAYPRMRGSSPSEPNKKTLRVIRGGRWNDAAADCRSAARDGYLPTSRFNDNGAGFRVVMIHLQPEQHQSAGDLGQLPNRR